MRSFHICPHNTYAPETGSWGKKELFSQKTFLTKLKGTETLSHFEKQVNTMRKNLPKTLNQLIFCKYTLVFSKSSQIY